MSKDIDFILKVLAFFSEEHDSTDSVWWRVDEDGVRFLINCNDLFYWASADCEEITPDNFTVLATAISDCQKALRASADPKISDDIYVKVYGFHNGLILFCARVRNERLQGAAYPKEKELWPLFDACGPARPIGIGNPYKDPDEYHAAFKSKDR